MRFEKIYEDSTCEESNIFINDEFVGYYVYYKQHKTFELYYNLDGKVSSEFDSSIQGDTLQECLEFADLV